jgi:hypothetical protein
MVRIVKVRPNYLDLGAVCQFASLQGGPWSAVFPVSLKYQTLMPGSAKWLYGRKPGQTMSLLTRVKCGVTLVRVEIRNDSWRGWYGIFMAPIFFVLGLAAGTGFLGPRFAQPVLPIVMGVGGVFHLLWGLLWLADSSVKLSLTREGLKDRRTGVMIRWEDVCGVRVKQATNKFQDCALLHVTMRSREIDINVWGLDRTPSDIALLVQERWLNSRGTDPSEAEQMSREK